MPRAIHPIADEALLQLVDGELPAAESSQLERHLAACEPCRARLQLLRAAATEADRVCTDRPARPDSDLDALRARVRGNIANMAGDDDRSWALRLSALTAAPIAAFAIAALLLLAAAAGLWRSPFRPAPQTADAGEIGVLPIAAFTPGA